MEPFLGEIKLMSFAFPPKGWALCNGQLLQIAQNSALFSLIGTQYGGDGQTTFALPDLRGRVPMGVGGAYFIGTAAGAESVVLHTSQLPTHTHELRGVAIANVLAPATAMFANAAFPLYDRATPNAPLASASLSVAGGSGAHENMQPYLTFSFCIALQGVFPSRE